MINDPWAEFRIQPQQSQPQDDPWAEFRVASKQEYVQPAPPPGAIVHNADGTSSAYLDNGGTVSMNRQAGGQAGISTPQQERHNSIEMEALQTRANRENAAPGDNSRLILPFVQGATFGFGDEAFSAGRATRAALEGRSFSDAYSVNQQVERQDLDRERREHPYRSLVSEIGAGIAAPVGAIGGMLKQGATAGQALVHGAKAGAIGGGLYGAGTADEGLENRATGAATGAVIGAAIGAPLGVAGNAIAGRAAPNAVAEAADNLGVQVPKAVATESRALQQVANAEANMPFAGPMLARSIDRAKVQLGESAEKVASEFGASERFLSGTRVRDALENTWISQNEKHISGLYDDVAKLVDPAFTARLESTSNAVSDILAARAQQRISDAGKAVNFVKDAVLDPRGLTYEGIKGLRTRAGELLKNKNALESQGVDVGELNRIYGALSDDLQNAVKASGSDKALAAFRSANSAHKEFSETRKSLLSLTNAKSDEQLFDTLYAAATTGARANLQLLAKSRHAMGKEAWSEFSGTIVSRMGRDVEGVFSPDRFVSDWNKVTPSARQWLFSSTERADLAKSLDDIATISSKFKQLGRYANPSGTAQAAATQQLLKGAGVVTAISNPLGVLAAVGGNLAIAKILSTPVTAKATNGFMRFAWAVAKSGGRGIETGLKQASRQYSSTLGRELGIQIDPARLYQGVIGRTPSYAEQEQDR